MFNIISLQGMQIVTRINYHYILTKIAKIKNNRNNPNAGEDTEKTDIADGEVKWYSQLLPVWQFLQKLNLQLPYDPAITLLNIHPREMKT